YKVGHLQQVLTRLAAPGRFPLDSIIMWDTLFTKTYLQAALDLQMGKGHIQEADAQWFLPNDDTFSGARYLLVQLRQPGTFPAFDTFMPQLPMYRLLREAVVFWRNKKGDAVFQHLHKAFVQSGSEAVAKELICRQLQQPGLEDSSAAYVYS